MMILVVILWSISREDKTIGDVHLAIYWRLF